MTSQPFEQKRILVTEHDMKVLQLLSEKIKVFGFKVETATTGNEALEKFQKFSPDMIIIDRDLKRINGIQLLMKLFFNNPGVKLMLSTDEEINYDKFQLKDNIVAIINKSSTLSELEKIFSEKHLISNNTVGGK